MAALLAVRGTQVHETATTTTAMLTLVEHLQVSTVTPSCCRAMHLQAAHASELAAARSAAEQALADLKARMAADAAKERAELERCA